MLRVLEHPLCHLPSGRGSATTTLKLPTDYQAVLKIFNKNATMLILLHSVSFVSMKIFDRAGYEMSNSYWHDCVNKRTEFKYIFWAEPH